MPDEVSKPVTPEESSKPKAGLTRREAIKVAAGIAGGIAMGTTPLVESVAAQGRSGGAPGSGITVQSNSNSNGSNNNGTLGLIGGNFVDGRGYVGNALTIKNGRIAAVGQLQALGPDAQVINLGGRTVIPGLIDSHAHYLRAGQRPGHDTREIETAFSIADVLAVISQRAATVPAGEFITAIGGFNTRQFGGSLPTRAQLDAAAPAHPVYLQAGIAGPSVTNSLGAAFFTNNGVAVGADGSLSAGPAFAALAAGQTFEDRKRSTRDLMRFSNSVGLTGVHDHAGLAAPGAGFFDFLRGYDPLLAVARDGDATVRLRLYFTSGDDASLTAIRARMDNAFMGFGDDLVRVAGLGEQIVSSSLAPHYVDALRLVAENGWGHSQHTGNAAEEAGHIAAFQTVNAETPIAALRWRLEHVFTINQGQLDALIDIGAMVGAQDQRYLSGNPGTGGPPFRAIVDSGIAAGAGTDATNVAPLNPWLALFYMVTGRNNIGVLINPGQTLSRLEALALYTIGSARLAGDEDQLGSFDVGKLADLAVLSADYLSVPEDDIRRIRSVLTVVGGKVVFSDGTLTAPV